VRVLVAGWFSFEYGHATAGDVISADVLVNWLRELDFKPDVASVAPFEGDVNWREVSPEDYGLVVFVCGPFEIKSYEAEFLYRFRRNRVIGINLSLNQSPQEWNPFDRLLERDSPSGARAELAFAGDADHVPVVGACLVEDYPEGHTKKAHGHIRALLNRHDLAIVPIDTRLDKNQFGLRSKSEVESLLARMDAVVTTRLHGMVLAIKNGVPVVPIDPKWGGGKIVRQAQTIGWPVSFSVDDLDPGKLDDALRFCLSAPAREQAKSCARQALVQLAAVKEELVEAIRSQAHDTDPELKKRSMEKLEELLPGD
jgi:hypothetical protein